MKTKQVAGMIIGTFAVATVGGFLLAPSFQDAVDGIKNSTLVDDPSISIGAVEDAKIALSPSVGLEGIGAHELKVKTNSPYGYKVSISSKTEETALTSKDTDSKIAAIDGTLDSPKVLTENTWGYSMAEEKPSIGAKWAGIAPTAATIVDSDQPNYDAESVYVYFGANVSKYVEAGTYSNTVVYSIVAKTDPTTLPAPTIASITPAIGTYAGGTRVTIVGENYTANGNSITTKVTIGGADCTDVEVLANTPVAGQDTITCTVPAHDGVNDTEDVQVTTWGGEATLADGFTYKISNVINVTPDLASTESGAESGPAFTIYGEGFKNADYPVTDVKIGDASCEEYQVISDAQITCTKGPNGTIATAGDYTVVVYHETGLRSGGFAQVEYTDEYFPEFSSSMTCDTDMEIYRDPRDSQLYYVAKMPDGKCWMVDNLKYTGYGTLSQVAGQALTVDKTNASKTGNYTVAKYVDPNAQNYCMNAENTPIDTVTRCGMLYNWYAATAGTGDDSLTTLGADASGSICPAGMKLPSSIVTGSEKYEASSYTTADFPVLVASLHYGAPSDGVNYDTSKKWSAELQPDGAWNGIFSGLWLTNFGNLGSHGYFWSSSVATKTDGRLRAHELDVIKNGDVATGDGSYANDIRAYGFAVRCVEE